MRDLSRTSFRPPRQILRLCVLLLLCQRGAAAKDKDAPTDELKLSSIKAHERDLKAEPPQFQARALFDELSLADVVCEQQLGTGALSDGKGDCHCDALEYFMANGTCKEYKGRKSVKANEEKLGLEVRLQGMPVCYSAKACAKVLGQRAESIDAELGACRRREEFLGDRVTALNATLESDLLAREAAAEDVRNWIRDLRTENQKMISELKKYTVLTEDNKRLKTDMQRMKAERARLEAKAEQLRDELQAAKAEREEDSGELKAEGERCAASRAVLKEGLQAAGLPIPAL